MENPNLKEFHTFADFFKRSLKKDARPIDIESEFISPCDGKVMSFGEIGINGELNQIKGVIFTLSQFVGDDVSKLFTSSAENDKSKYYFCIIYLAPGDYHRFHAPTDFKIDFRRHIPGYLFPVSPWSAKFFRGLFAVNERIVLLGQWKYGNFCMAPVGAYNVGSIELDFDPTLKTNVQPIPRSKLYYDEKFEGEKLLDIKKGDQIGAFSLGSTIVLIWENNAQKIVEFNIEVGKKIKFGEKLLSHSVDIPIETNAAIIQQTLKEKQ